jgi:hypothetical protein
VAVVAMAMATVNDRGINDGNNDEGGVIFLHNPMMGEKGRRK